MMHVNVQTKRSWFPFARRRSNKKIKKKNEPHPVSSPVSVLEEISFCPDDIVVEEKHQEDPLSSLQLVLTESLDSSHQSSTMMDDMSTLSGSGFGTDTDGEYRTDDDDEELEYDADRMQAEFLPTVHEEESDKENLKEEEIEIAAADRRHSPRLSILTRTHCTSLIHDDAIMQQEKITSKLI